MNNKSVNQNTPLLILLTCYAAVVVFVNPVRETPMADDWAYARTVRALLATGRYQPDAWASANMPVQTFIGTAASSIFGFSHSVLRLSTIVLFGLAQVAFYRIAIDLKATPVRAGTLTLALMASPLILTFTFTFMTDVQFLSWLIISVCLYSIAIREANVWKMLLASVCAAAAIGTRQYGVALLPALIGSWVADRRPNGNSAFYLAGIMLPLISAMGQLVFLQQPLTPYMSVNLDRQGYFLRSGEFLAAMAMRPVVVFQYLAFFTLPVMPFLLAAIVRSLFSPEAPELAFLGFQTRRALGRGTAFASTYILMAEICRYVATDRLMPTLPWNFNFVREMPFVPLILTVATTIFAIPVAVLAIGYISELLRRPKRPIAWLLGSVSAALLGLILIYHQFGDRYMIVLVPWLLLACVPLVNSLSSKKASALLALGVLAFGVSSLLTRARIVEPAAEARAANAIVEQGVPPDEIAVNWMWNSYHGAFELFLIEDGFARSFFEWYDEWRKDTDYFVVKTQDVPIPSDPTFVTALEYRDYLFRPRYMVVSERGPRK